MWRGNEDNALYRIEKGFRFWVPIRASSVGCTERLLHHKAAQTVAYEYEREAPQFALPEKTFEDILGAVLDRHCRAEPVSWRRLVGEGPGGQTWNVACEPNRPEGVALSALTPSVVGMSPEPMHEYNIGPSARPPTSDFDQSAHGGWIQRTRQACNRRFRLAIDEYIKCRLGRLRPIAFDN